ncbi:oxidoreductase [Rhodococcus koreensis]
MSEFLAEGSASIERYPVTASPVRLGGCIVPNRIVRTAHATGLGDGGITDGLIDYHFRCAEGGVGLTILEYAAVHPSSPTELQAYQEEAVAGWERLMARIRPTGMRVFQQLWHGGAQGPGYLRPVPGLPPRSADWAPSALPGPSGNATVEMTTSMIDAVVMGFGEAARRCEQAGLDGVEVHAGHGYLLCQFLSPLTNRREDHYGGSLKNRSRLLREVLRAIRAMTSRNFPVGVRVSSTEGLVGGLAIEDTLSVVLELESAGLIDFVNVSAGAHRTNALMVGTMSSPEQYMMPLSAQITAKVEVPSIVAGRFLSLEHCEDVLASGTADMVAMVRAHIADPELVSKSLEGAESQVRPCISCNEGCVGGRRTSGVMGCTVNPAVTRRGPIYPHAYKSRSVVVVGGGPAGLQTAHAAAARGHHVTLYERRTELGGLISFARRAPYRAEQGKIVDWFDRELTRLDVDVRVGCSPGVEKLLEDSPDAIVIATGALPRRDGVQRARLDLARDCDLTSAVTPLEVLSGEATATRALVVDDLGTYPAIAACEHLLIAGAEVTLATSHPMLAPAVVPTGQWDALSARLSSYSGFRFLPRTALAFVEGSWAQLLGIDDLQPAKLEIDLLVLMTGFTPQRELFDELKNLEAPVHLVGDANVPGGLQRAIAAGYELGLML